MSMGFGDMLLNRRRQMGLSIQQVANTIKMRPQIIEYFETGNYEAMPPRGYAQGMISSYARFLGLNPREVVDAYFEGLYRYEHSPNASGPANFTGAMDASPRSANATGRYLMVDTRDAGSRFAQRPPQAGYVPESRSPHEMAPGHRLRAGAAAAPRRAPGGSGDGTLGRTTSMPAQRPRTRGAARGAGSLSASPRAGRTRDRGAYVGSAGSRSRSRSRRGGGARGGLDLSGLLGDRRLVIGLMALVALLLVAVILLTVRTCSGGTPVTAPAATATTASDTGSTATATDTAATTETAATDQAAGSASAETQPTQYEVAVTYTGDATAWVEIKVDGALASESGRVSKGFTHTYTVKDSIEISTDSTSDVEVTRDGQRVRYDSRSSGIGRITITVPKPAATDAAATDGTAADATAQDGTAADAAATDAATATGDTQTATQQ